MNNAGFDQRAAVEPLERADFDKLASDEGSPRVDRLPDYQHWWRCGQGSLVGLRPRDWQMPPYLPIVGWLGSFPEMKAVRTAYAATRCVVPGSTYCSGRSRPVPLATSTGCSSSTSSNPMVLATGGNEYRDDVVRRVYAQFELGFGATTATMVEFLRDPKAILADPALRATLDLTQPVGLLHVAVLHFLADADEPHRHVSRLVQDLSPGSYLALTHATFEPLPADGVQRLTALAAPGAGHGAFRTRTRTRGEVACLLHGLHLVEPGIVPIVDRQPDRDPKPAATRRRNGRVRRGGPPAMSARSMATRAHTAKMTRHQEAS